MRKLKVAIFLSLVLFILAGIFLNNFEEKIPIGGTGIIKPFSD